MKALIFDMDGVIIDSERFYNQKDRAWFAQQGIRVDWKEFYKTMGTTSRTMQEKLREWNPDADFDALMKKHHEFWKQQVVDYRLLFRPAVCDLISQCRTYHIKTALASSSSMKNIMQVVDQCGLQGCFDVILSGEDLENSKPDPAIFLLCAEKLQVDCSDCVVIEDSTNGVIAGKRAGMVVIGLTDPYFDLDLSEADSLTDSLSSLEVVMDRIYIKKA